MLGVAIDPVLGSVVGVPMLVFGAWCIVANWGIALGWWLRKERASSVPLVVSAFFLIGASLLFRGWSWWFLLVFAVDFISLMTLGWLCWLLAAWGLGRVRNFLWSGYR